MASSLIDSLSTDFDPNEFRDEYREALLAVIDSKLAGGMGLAPVASADSGDGGDGIVLDLMAALRESVERHQSTKAAAVADDVAEPAAKPRRAATSTPKSPATKTASKTAAKPPAKKAAPAVKSTSTAAEKKAAKTEAPAKTRSRRTA